MHPDDPLCPCNWTDEYFNVTSRLIEIEEQKDFYLIQTFMELNSMFPEA